MRAAHKNECRGVARQVVKTLSKYATDFIACAARFATLENIIFAAFLMVMLNGFAARLGVL